MKNLITKAALAVSVLSSAGCAGTNVLDSQPLFFAQGITLGVTGGTAPQNGNTPEFTLGYKQLNVALVPTVVPGVVTTDKDGNPVPVDADVLTNAKIVGQDFEKDTGEGPQDALSTFGSFEAETGTNKVNLGVFFATGVAAQKIADGFKEHLSNTPNTQPAAEDGGGNAGVGS